MTDPDLTADPDLDVIELLERQHEEVRRLFREVQQASGEDRAEAFGCLVRLLAVHETAEEMVVHLDDLLLRRLRGRKNAYLARRMRDLPPEDVETLERAAEILDRMREGERG